MCTKPGDQVHSVRWYGSTSKCVSYLNCMTICRIFPVSPKAKALRQSSGSFPSSESGRSCGNVQRSLQLTARRCPGGCVQVERLSLGHPSHFHILIQTLQILYIPSTASSFDQVYFVPLISYLHCHRIVFFNTLFKCYMSVRLPPTRRPH